MRTTLVALAALAISTPLAAQANGMAGMNMDPTKAIHGSGALPAGWMMRFDPPRRPGAPVPALTAVSVTTEGKGIHFLSGPAATYYATRMVPSGNYIVSATFAQQKSMQHEAYGLVVGANHMQDSTESYLYFLVRPMDGAVLINMRNGDDAKKIVKIVDWTPNAAVHKDDPTSGAASNELEVHVEKGLVRFFANGTEVKSISRAELQTMGLSLEGSAGVRVNHNLDLQVDGFGIKEVK